ncbi:ATP-binding protein [Accumulibacter sp.]|uniref:ATP-binding protein n=1 Tax=Accumulibacter sp. TaxID=2053492 RepID=UPI0025F612BB|nr:ATP-binding protein [Accumulibacter sp.]MCM8593865.1 ATP-binding protein [Accumulibacter sp.]MCM8626093.1 ATP-binding protein [Accumulibacter sp.]MDS4048006.1 ATP-binding protein [Accumulibacter sp.]
MKPDDLRPMIAEAEDTASGECFRPLLLAAAWRIAIHAHELLGDQIDERFPFLSEYAAAFEAGGDEPPEHPLRALASCAGWPANAIDVWLVHGLPEEDARFAAVFQALDLDSGGRRPSLTLMQAWWGTLPREGLRPALRALLDCGLLAGNAEGGYLVEENCWAAARGEAPGEPLPGVCLQPATAAPALADLLLPDETRRIVDRLTTRLAESGGTVIVRGPEHNGRGSLLAALARSEGRPTLTIDWPLPAGEVPLWLGAFAALTGARPLFRLRANPGERLRLPRLPGYDGWVGVVCADDDALDDPPLPARRLTLPLPDAALRERLLAAGAPELTRATRSELAALLHLSSGHLRRALAQGLDPLQPPAELAAALREVALAAGSAELDGLARRLETSGTDWHSLVLDHDLRRDLDNLEARCRQRDRLRETLPQAFAARLNAGVRALLAGPSGTGKTLAAQVLAGRLGVPLYRLDLSSVVSKYIGETERNLHRLFAAAEALDVMLLLDEGDALLARRTSVGNAHDRYANLETNFLLQRLESHRGLVLVTTNALERIDDAFLRRFDVLLNFRLPEAGERLALWRAHLPHGHAIAAPVLERIAEACLLSGGQVRNVVLAAASSALAVGRPIDEEILFDALRREYRRSGGLFPLGG